MSPGAAMGWSSVRSGTGSDDVMKLGAGLVPTATMSRGWSWSSTDSDNVTDLELV